MEARVGIAGGGEYVASFLVPKKWVVPQTTREALPEVDTNFSFK